MDQEVVTDDYDDEPPYTRRRLRTAACLGVAALAGLLAWALWGPLYRAVSLASELAWDHWPWAVMPVVALISALPIWGYAEASKFFDDYSSGPAWTGGVVGASIAILLALQLDSSMDLLGTLAPDSRIGWVGVSIIVPSIAALATYLRRRDSDAYLDWPFALGSVAAVLVAIPSIYIVVRGLWNASFWTAVGSKTGDFLSGYWSPTLLAIVVVLQAPSWSAFLNRRRRRGARAGGVTFLADMNLGLGLVGAATTGLALYVLLYYLPDTIVGTGGLTAAERAEALAQERRTLLAAIAAVGAAFTLVYTHLRHQLDRDSNATGRYTEGVQQLGADSMSIRLGGIYALSRVARDSPGDRTTVSEVLAAFVRDSSRTMPTGVPLDVIAAIGELGRVGTDEYEPINLRSCKLIAGNLESVSFPENVDLRQSDLTGANLFGAELRGANLSGATLNDAILREVHANRATFRESAAQFADFENAYLDESVMSGANLTGSRFVQANLADSDFEDANLTNADFTGANLEGANLRNAILTGATFDKAYVEDAVFFGTGCSAEDLSESVDVERAIFVDPYVHDEVAERSYKRRRRRSSR